MWVWEGEVAVVVVGVVAMLLCASPIHILYPTHTLIISYVHTIKPTKTPTTHFTYHTQPPPPQLYCVLDDVVVGRVVGYHHL